MAHRIAIVLALFLCLSLGACGSETKDASSGSGSGSSSAKGSGSSSAKGSGHESPSALLDAMAKMGADGDELSPVEIVRLVHPDEQKAAAFMFSVLPMVFAPMMMAFGGEEKEKEMKPLLTELEGMMKKYGLEDMEKKLEALAPGDDLTDEQKLAALDTAMGDLDHLALVQESWDLMQRIGEATKSEEGGMTESNTLNKLTPEVLAKAKASLKVDGKTATVKDPLGDGKDVVLVQADDGFWYLSILKSKMLGE